MPGRIEPPAGAVNRYKYGFNGKENDNEVVGTGEGTQDYGFRIYNPALGKFLSVDPLSPQYPYYSPFQFAGNMPINCIDLDGGEPKPSYTAEDIAYIGPGADTKTYETTGQTISKVDGYWVYAQMNGANPAMTKYFWYDYSAKKGSRWTKFSPESEEQKSQQQAQVWFQFCDVANQTVAGIFTSVAVAPLLLEYGAVYGTTSLIDFGSYGMSTYLKTAGLRFGIDALSSIHVNGIEGWDPSHSLYSGLLTPLGNATFGGATQWKPFSDDKSFKTIFSTGIYHKDLTNAAIDFGAKTIFSGNTAYRWPTKNLQGAWYPGAIPTTRNEALFLMSPLKIIDKSITKSVKDYFKK